MLKRAEAPFLVNGVKSWVECLFEAITVSGKTAVESYHFHDYIELLYATTSGATVWINGTGYELAAGELAVINSNMPHTVTYEGSPRYICIKFLPSILYTDEQSVLEFQYALPFLLEGTNRKPFRASNVKGADIHALLLDCMREWDAKESGFELVIRANLLKIFAAILRHWRAEGLELPSAAPTDAIKSALAYVEKHYRTASEREVAAACGISYNHFSATFKRALGHSFTAHVTALKLREAERLLMTTDRSITEIASHLGFSTTSHFIARFRETRGITPAQFRRRVTVNQSQNGSKI